MQYTEVSRESMKTRPRAYVRVLAPTPDDKPILKILAVANREIPAKNWKTGGCGLSMTLIRAQ